MKKFFTKNKKNLIFIVVLVLIGGATAALVYRNSKKPQKTNQICAFVPTPTPQPTTTIDP